MGAAEAEGQGRTTVLNEEIHSIHYANRLFWSEQSHNREARIGYYFRQDRLEEIRCELGGLAGLTDLVDPLPVSTPLFAAIPLRYPKRSSCQL
jgi:hypothetical protein